MKKMNWFIININRKKEIQSSDAAFKMIEMVVTFNTGKTMKNIFECAALRGKIYVQTNTNAVMCHSKLDYVREQLNFFFRNTSSWTNSYVHAILAILSIFFNYSMFRLWLNCVGSLTLIKQRILWKMPHVKLLSHIIFLTS